MTRRNLSLDILRIIAAIDVVVFHVFGSSANNDPLVSANLKTIVANINNMLMWHVPVFFILTGYLWLRDGKPCTFKKMIPNIRRFVLVLFTVGFAYAVMERIFVDGNISLSLFINSIGDVFTGDLWDHMWYVYSIIGVYLILPVLKILFENSSKKTAGYFVALLFVFSVLVQLVEKVSGYKFPVSIPSSSTLFYVCFGGLVAKARPKINVSFPIAGFFISSVATFFITRYVDGGTVFLVTLKSISAVCLFISFLQFRFSNKESKFISVLSDCTFGIYLFHPLFINIMVKLLHIYPFRYFSPISLPLACAGIVLASFVVTYILRCIPIVKKYIL